MNILLVRHGLSESNKDRTVHQELPDHAIPLAPEGRDQAEKAGYAIQKWIQANSHCGDHIRMWVSPYLRTKQTADIIQTKSWPDGKSIITDRVENVALCEQQFGLFDGLSDEELQVQYPNEHSHYQKAEKFEGRFWARMPLGESRFDVALRVHQLFGTWLRDVEKHGIENIVVVSHGVTIRAILMRWLHLPVEWFEKEPNPPNCSVRLISKNKSLGYIHR